MPPLPAIYAGQERAAEFLTEVAFRLVPEARFVETQANRQPALAVYSRDGGTGRWHGSGLLVLTARGSQVCALTRFESHTLTAFGMPRCWGQTVSWGDGGSSAARWPGSPGTRARTGGPACVPRSR